MSFRRTLEDYALNKCRTTCGTDVVTYDRKLQDLEPQYLPLLVATVRTEEEDGAGELGTKHDLFAWTIHIYYFDIEIGVDAPGENLVFDRGDERRNGIMQKLKGAFMSDFNFGALSVNDTDAGYRESVYDVLKPTTIFDASGQEGYYSFVSEMYLTVRTQKSLL